MNVKRLIRRRRAVSPILAAILLIGLAVAAGAVLFTVVMPLIDSPGGSVVFDETKTTLSDTAAHVVLRNDGTVNGQVTGITIMNTDNTGNFTFVQFNVNYGQGATKDYTFDEPLPAGTYTITVSFSLDGEVQTPIAIDLTVA
jgi:flagellin-like protein